MKWYEIWGMRSIFVGYISIITRWLIVFIFVHNWTNLKGNKAVWIFEELVSGSLHTCITFTCRINDLLRVYCSRNWISLIITYYSYQFDSSMKLALKWRNYSCTINVGLENWSNTPWHHNTAHKINSRMWSESYI